jgi:hypothetical protein
VAGIIPDMLFLNRQASGDHDLVAWECIAATQFPLPLKHINITS